MNTSSSAATGGGKNALHRIHQWSIEHAHTVAAFYIAVTAAAVFCTIRVIPRRFAPYVPSPMAAVVTMMPGLSARQMETYVSKPIEEQMTDLKNLRYIRSTSQQGLSIVTLQFHYGTNISHAIISVQNLLNVAQANLPATGANVKPSFVVPIDPLNLPVVSLALTGDLKRGWTLPRLRQLADNTITNRLRAVNGVSAITTFGGYRRQMQVIVDRNKLAALHISLLDVRRAIDRYNVSQPAGLLTTPYSQALVQAGIPAQTAEQIARYPLLSSSSGSAASEFGKWPHLVRIGDVARVADTVWERKSAFQYVRHLHPGGGSITPAIEVSVIQNPAASSYTLMPRVQKTLKQLEKEYPGIHFQAAYNNAHFVSILFHNVWEELAVAVLLTAIVVFFFLGEWRGTLIALITLPVSLSFAVLMLIPFHLTFNSGTLIGLLISIGRLVDDTIIDIHSVERHLRMGKDPKTATIDGIAEVRLAVLASTLMLALALAPLLFCGGITQLMFVELVWPLLFSLLASMMVSFTLTAVLCAKLLRTEQARAADRRNPVMRAILFLADPFQRFLDRLEAAYRRSIEAMLRNRFWNLARIAVTVIMGFTFYNFIGSEMMPLADVGQAAGFLEMKPGTSFQQTDAAVHNLEQIMLKYPQVRRASVETGAENMFESWNPNITGYQMPQTSGAAFMLTLSDKDKRRQSIWQIIDSIQQRAMRTIPGIRRLQIKEMGSDVMATADAPVYLNISGPRLSELHMLAQQALQIAKRTPGLAQPALTSAMGVPDYHIEVSPARAEALGLSPVSVAQQAYYALHGGLASQFYHVPNVRQDTILIRYRQSQRITPQNLQNLIITAPDGQQAPLKSLAHIVLRSAPTAIEHDGLERVAGLAGYYRKGGPPSMDLTMTLMMKIMDRLNFPPGYSLQVRGDMTQMMSSFRRLLYGLLLSLGLMYLVLAAQFRSFLQPLQMIASLPLELSGVFLALWLAHQAFSTVSILGVIVLTGMDITTAILIIDRIMACRDAGIPRDQAVAEAAPQRLRPILMTSLITIITMAPVAFAPKTGLDAYQPLATTILGGLTVGTFLSLFDIPILHTLVDDFVQTLHRSMQKRAMREQQMQPPAAQSKGDQ